MVLPTMSPMPATPSHSDCSPESETTTGRVGSSDFISATSFFKNSLSYHGHRPNLKSGSFSACQAIMDLLPLYRVTTSFTYCSTPSCCSVFESPSAQPGTWHSGHLPVFMPTTYSISASYFSASLICQSISLK